jgi:hypothetical protein
MTIFLSARGWAWVKSLAIEDDCRTTMCIRTSEGKEFVVSNPYQATAPRYITVVGACFLYEWFYFNDITLYKGDNLTVTLNKKD